MTAVQPISWTMFSAAGRYDPRIPSAPRVLTIDGNSVPASDHAAERHRRVADDVAEQDREQAADESHRREQAAGPDFAERDGGPGPEQEEIQPTQVPLVFFHWRNE